MKKMFLLIFSFSVIGVNNVFAQAVCTILPVSLDFGTINPYDQTFETMNTTVTIRCTSTITETVRYTLSFDGGSSQDIRNRLMVHTNNTNNLSYLISRRNNHNFGQLLGDGANRTRIFSRSCRLRPGNNFSCTRNHTIFGRIPVQTGIIPGVYTDNVTLTLDY